MCQERKALQGKGLIQALRELNSHDDFSFLTNSILRVVSEVFSVQAATLLLTNKMTGDLEIAAVKNVPEDVVTHYMQKPTRAKAVAEYYHPANNRFGLQLRNEEINLLAAAEYQVFVILPIQIQDKIIGYLTLASNGSLFSEQAEQEKMGIFLEYIAQRIENAYYIYQLLQQNARLELMMTKLQNSQNHLKRAEKMALVGKIAATMAHEIRNPLTVIGTSLQLVYDKLSKDNPDYDLFQQMISRVRSVDQTIKELLVFARPMKIELKALDLEDTLDHVIGFVRKKYESRGLTIEKQFPDELPKVFMDEEQTQRIVINLLLNAYNFLPENGTVVVRAWHNAGDPYVTMEVVDNGPGIAAENSNDIFEIFYTTRSEGNGLGLFLVKHLLEEMNGTITVQSDGKAGAEFKLRLPVDK